MVRAPVTEIAIDGARRRGSADVAIVDVRSAHEYDGHARPPCDPRQGHIPGARHLDVQRLMQLDAGEIEPTLGDRAGRRGRRLLPQRLPLGDRDADPARLGYDARNYVGSWHEWSRHDHLPVEP